VPQLEFTVSRPTLRIAPSFKVETENILTSLIQIDDASPLDSMRSIPSLVVIASSSIGGRFQI
jgi:hypothetical protein